MNVNDLLLYIHTRSLVFMWIKPHFCMSYNESQTIYVTRTTTGWSQHFVYFVYYRSLQSSCWRNLQGGLFLDPDGGPQQDLEAIHCKTVPQSQSSFSSTIPSPQKVASDFLRQEMRWAAAKLALTDLLVQGERIWWFNLWPSLENFDIKKRPLIHWKVRLGWNPIQ